MLKLASLLRRSDSAKAPTADPGSAAERSFSETPLAATKRWTFGRSLAFHVGEGFIQMAAARHRGPSTRILDVSRVPLLNEMEPVETRADHIANTVVDYVARFGGIGTEINLVIGGRGTAFRCFLMPTLKPTVLKSAIRFEAGKQIPFPLDETVFDYRCTFKLVDDRRSRYRVALHAGTERKIKEQLEPFRRNKLEVNRVVNADDAVGHLLDHIPDFDHNGVFTLVEVGQERCKICYYRGSALEFLHTGTVGMSQLGEHPDITRIEYFAENLANELAVSQDYYTGNYGKVLPSEAYICGELAARTDLIEQLNGKTSFEFAPFPTDRLDWMKNRRVSFASLLPVCLPVVAAVGVRSRLCELLPPGHRRRRIIRKVDHYSRLSLALLGTILITAWIYLHMSVSSERALAESLEQQASSALQSEAYATHHALLQQIALDRAYLKRAEADTGYFNLNLKELSLVTPSAISLYRLEFASHGTGPGMVLYGNVASSGVPPEVILAQYVERLKESPCYQDVSLVRHSKRKVNGRFLIDFQIEMQGAA